VSSSPGFFLDRDGVINALVPDPRTGTNESPYHPDDVALMPGAAEALEQLGSAGMPLVVVSNQPAAAKGIVSEAELDAVHERVLELLGPSAQAVGDWRYCRHHPEAVDPALRSCECRKPSPGMLREASAANGIDLRRSWMVGDSETDIEAGRAAGCRTALVLNPDSAHRRSGAAKPDLMVRDLPEAASALLTLAS
jgi:D-glycero-D-manno-heptose 1,7-bisphosphate phosphatase